MVQMKFAYRRPDWRNYQCRLQKRRMRKQTVRRTFRYSVFLTFLTFLGVGAYGISGKVADSPVLDFLSAVLPSAHTAEVQEFSAAAFPGNADGGSAYDHIFSKNEIRSLLSSAAFLNIREKSFHLQTQGHSFQVETTIDIPLQNFVLENMDRGNSRYIGIVAMDPRTGRILAMAGHDSANPHKNPCTDALFPAASVFKIVIAAAAVEECGFSPDSTISFRGAKHTLYKSQLPLQSAGNLISLRDSFAQSVNPVFGKLGVHFLGKTAIESYANAFGFNRPISFEIPVEISTVSLAEDDPYQWAEIASGFNRSTAISPLHGAMMVSGIVSNADRLVEPTIVEQISNATGRVLYRGRPKNFNRFISPAASDTVKKMMEETIRTGTCRKTFRGYDRDPILSRLNIGGKTGTINSRNHPGRRYDWFVGFAEEKEGQEQIVLSAVVTHEKLVSIKAKEYARMAMAEYFRNYYSKQEAPLQKADAGTLKPGKSI
ncbi:MAG: penicillin-binding transpeptidase domain-containing protein [Desulfobacterales bacterium]